MVLTEGIRRALQDGAASLKGYARRLFMARTVRDFGPGGQRFAERELGWNRRTIRKGEHELRTGVQCVAAFNARGRKPIDARLPNLRADIKDLIDSQSQERLERLPGLEKWFVDIAPQVPVAVEVAVGVAVAALERCR